MRITSGKKPAGWQIAALVLCLCAPFAQLPRNSVGWRPLSNPNWLVTPHGDAARPPIQPHTFVWQQSDCAIARPVFHHSGLHARTGVSIFLNSSAALASSLDCFPLTLALARVRHGRAPPSQASQKV